ncbi:MAG: hypothetical protein P8013_02140 [Candidatus Sulfobium sp.]
MLKLKNIGGESVKAGTYWNFSTGDRVQMESAGILPGNESHSYYKFPPAVVLILGPVLGLAYAVFLPFIGIAMLAGVLGKKVFGGAVETARKGATFSWRPSEAYLAGKKGEPEEKKEDKERRE